MIKKVNELALRAYVKADIARSKAKQEITELANNEMGVSGIVVSLLLIAIAVALAIVFRDKIAELMNKIFGNLDEPTNDLSNPDSIGG